MTVQIKWDAPSRFVEIKGNPIPARAEVGMHQMRDGKMLRGAVFHPEGSPRGTLVLMTGYSEFIEKYFETVGDFTARGFVVVMPEWRGHGLSEGDGIEPTRLHLKNFDTNLADLEDRWAALIAPLPKPHFGLAHSMGGQISLRAAQAHPEWLEALAQCAPMYALPIPAHLMMIGRAISGFYRLLGKADRWNPFQGVAERPGDAASNDVTNDFDRFRRTGTLYVTEPQLQVNGASLGWFAAADKAMADTRRVAFLKSVETPLFIASAGQEKLVTNLAHTHVIANVQNGSGKIYADGMHELMMEKDALRQTFINDVVAFFDGLN
ncbi:MAG: alpha/beta hydrolase [Alphaproteobacteria bacterium]|nr:alpha/beta hydrolase [Alphaproteobacteria bacterium]